jgi:pilus assembly protein CpaF
MGIRNGSASNHDPLASEKRFQAVKTSIHGKLVEMIDISKLSHWKPERLQREVRQLAQRLIDESDTVTSWSAANKKRLLADLMSEMFGLGPLDRLMDDPTVSDILVNGPHQVFIERNGRLEETGAVFADNAHLLQIIQRIAARIGRRADELSPMVDARLEDGSRVNAIIPPLSLDGAVLSIRRFGVRLTDDALLANGTLPPEMLELLHAAVAARISALVSGGTGSGKTTLLNILSHCIPRDERLVTIEDSAELRLNQPHVIRLETRPANLEGVGEVRQRDLVRNALRMRPDRIIIGEVRGAEALDMLQAMNTGHEGSLTTIHANDTRDALARLEMMVMMAGDSSVCLVSDHDRRATGPPQGRPPQDGARLRNRRHEETPLHRPRYFRLRANRRLARRSGRPFLRHRLRPAPARSPESGRDRTRAVVVR